MASNNPIVAALRKDVVNTVTPNLCYGTIPLESNESGLFYKTGRGSIARFIDFADDKLKDEEIRKLVEASEKATFGRNSEDVLDESYRKAWKMDTSQFSTQFDVAKSGILDVVHDQLLHYEKNTKGLVAHLYKLNVYGPGSFFKPHVDTPRSDKLFATLVVVLPTVHKGGNLLLGENGDLLNFDSAKEVYDPESKAPRLAFVSFYSDIEHQVLPVESGYRVTLTYNLHLTEFDGVFMLKTLGTNSFTSLLISFGRLIASATALPKGGVLGFGLLYRYPIDPKTTNLAAFTGALKGNDALIKGVCKALGLETSVKVLYTEKDGGFGGDKFLTDDVKDGEDISDSYDEIGHRELFKMAGGKLVTSPDNQSSSSFKVPVLWITRPTRMVTADVAFMTYGNEANIDYAYGDLVLIAKVPAYRERVEHLKKNLPESVLGLIFTDVEKATKELPKDKEEVKEVDSDEEEVEEVGSSEEEEEEVDSGEEEEEEMDSGEEEDYIEKALRELPPDERR